MKKVILTTNREQSQNLLYLDFPIDSADCWLDATNHPHFLPDGVLYTEWLKASQEEDAMPCWSLGKLIYIDLMARIPKEGELPRLSFTYKEVEGDAEQPVDFIDSMETHFCQLSDADYLNFDRL